jgi:hypothetical protein
VHVAHGDVKPSNLFLTQSLQLVLGDFDTLRDVSAGHTTFTSAVSACTRAFAAPELLQGEKATSASDVFAVGRVAEALFSGEPPPARDFVRICTQTDPAQRPTVAQLLQHPLLVDSVTQPDEAIVFCFACQDNYRASRGASCVGSTGESHFLCTECIGAQIASSEGRWLDANGMFCTYTGCDRRFRFHELPALTEAQHAVLMRARDQLMELVYVLPKEAEIARLKDELVQQDEEAKLKLVQLQRQLADARDDKRARDAAVEAERRLKLEQAQRVHVSFIVDHILTLCCPVCKRAVDEMFDGCCALTCGTADRRLAHLAPGEKIGCGAGICGCVGLGCSGVGGRSLTRDRRRLACRYCGAHCGNDAHAHVANCRWNSVRPRDVFARKEQYLADRRAFKDAMTAEYIDKNVEEHHRDAVRRRIAALR